MLALSTISKLFGSVLYALIFFTRAESATDDCENKSVARHGYVENYDDIDKIECPNEGVIIAINHTYSYAYDIGHRLCSISFTRRSSEGLTTYGPFGKTGENSHVEKCADNQYFGYLRGREGRFINIIQMVCLTSWKASFNTKQEERDKLNAGSDDQVNQSDINVDEHSFDDSCFVKNGKRPVTILVSTKTYVNAIEISYDAIPVELNCKPTKIELIGNNTSPEITGYELLGIVVGSTCSRLQQQLCLAVQESRLSSNTSGYSLLNGIMFDVNAGIGFNGGQVFLGLGWDVSVDVKFGKVKNSEWKFEYSVSFSEEVDKEQKTTINYDGPGAAVVVGYRSTYKIKEENADILYHYTCERGSTPPTNGQLNIQGNLYGNVHFQDFHFPFGDRQCTTELRLCISRIKLESFVFRPKSLNTKLTTEVNKCFIDN